MGCCLFVIVGALWPRLALIYLYLFTTIPRSIFHTALAPLLGFLFLPTTTLAYALCLFYIGPLQNPWCLVLMALAFLHDLGQLGAFRRRRKE